MQNRSFSPFLFALFIILAASGAIAATAAGNVSCGATGINLDTANARYTLNASYSVNGTCFTVTAANVTLDCVGYTITGNNSTSTYGVYSDRYNTTVKNCNITNFSIGVDFNGATNGTISNVNANTTRAASGSDGTGIYLASSNYINVSNSAGMGNDGLGIWLTSSNNNTISNTVATSASGYGSRVQASVSNTFSNFTAISSGDNGIYVSSTSNSNTFINSAGISKTSGSSSAGIYIASNNHNTFINSTGTSNFSSGVVVSSGSFTTLTNVTGTSNSSTGIYLTAGSNNTVSGSTGTSNTGVGILLDTNANNNTISNSVGTSNTTHGVDLNGVANNTVSNTIGTTRSSGGASAGIYVISSSYIVLSNATGIATNASYGIWLNSATFNIISNSAATSFANAGIRLSSSSNNNTLSNSTGSSTSDDGVYVSSSSSYNVFYNFTGTSNSSSGSSAGMYLSASNYNNVSNSAGIATASGGIVVSSSSYTLISNSTGTTNSSVGISFVSGTNNTVSNSVGIANVGHGISFDASSPNNSISGSNGTSVSGYGITIASNSNTLSNTTGTSNSNIGILISGANNTIFNATGTSYSGIGFRIFSGSNNTISNSTGTSYSNSGISLSTNAVSNTFSNSIGISSQSPGVSFASGSNNNQLIHTTAYTANSSINYPAMVISLSRNNTIDCQGATFYAGTTNFNDPSGIGISVPDGNNNTTIKNCIFREFYQAILFEGVGATNFSMNKTIINNTIINTINQTNNAVMEFPRIMSFSMQNGTLGLQATGAMVDYIQGGPTARMTCNLFSTSNDVITYPSTAFIETKKSISSTWNQNIVSNALNFSVYVIGDSISAPKDTERQLDAHMGTSSYLNDYGVSGYRCDQTLTVYQNNSLFLNQSNITVLVVCGINDALHDDNASVIESRIDSIYNLSKARGNKLVLTNIGTSPTVNCSVVTDVNNWLVTYTASKGVPLVDLHHMLYNGNDSTCIANTSLSSDGIHPGGYGLYLFGDTIWKQGFNSFAPFSSFHALASDELNTSMDVRCYSNDTGMNTLQLSYTSLSADSITLLLNGSAANITYAYSPSFQLNASANSTSGTHALYLNGSSISNPYGAVLAAGYYNFTANSSGNANYFGASVSYFANVSAAPSTLSLNATNWSATVGAQTNVTCAIDNSQTNVSLYRDGVLVNSSIGGSVSDLATLAVGTYNYTCNSSASQNYSAASQASHILAINKMADAVNLTLNGSSSNISYAYSPSYVLSINASSSSGTQSIYQNGALVGTSNYSAILGAGYYNFTANSTGNANYTNASLSYFANVSKAASNITMNATSWSATVGAQTNVTCAIDNSQTNVSLYRDGVLVNSSIGGSVSDLATLAVGTYNYTCNSSASQNYSAATAAIGALTVSSVPSPPSSGGGGSSVSMSLSYSFNCSSGSLAIAASSGSSALSGITVRLAKPNGDFGFATTGSDGNAIFAITESGQYSAESQQSGAYSPSYLSAFGLALCPQAPYIPPTPSQNTTTPAINTTLPPASNVTNTTSPPPANTSQAENLANEAIASAKAGIDAAKAAGKDTSRAQSALSSALLALNAGNFEQALSLAKGAPLLVSSSSSQGSSSAAANASAQPQQQPSPAQAAFPLLLAAGIVAVIAIAAAALYFIAKGKKKGL